MHPPQTLAIQLVYLQNEKQTRIVLGQVLEKKKLLNQAKIDSRKKKYSIK